MKTYKFKYFIKKIIPKFVMKCLSNRRGRRNINIEFANYILTSAIEYSKIINGDTGSFDRKLKYLIENSENNCNSIIQDILTAFMPNYEMDLYRYYKNQEYLIFYRFLTYPFSSNMSGSFLPYKKGLSRFKSYDILDYGAGIPYGLIYSLHNNNNIINSITLIDLDLVHVDFVQFLIRNIAPNIKLDVYKLNNTDSFPNLKGEYNFFFGKDIFEHLSDPLKNLKLLMNYSKPEAVCYFDFNDHGKKIYQHITPNIEFLSNEMKKYGFRRGEKVSGLSEFIRET